MKKKRMIMKILKKEWFIWKFEKRGDSREKGGGGNEIHAPSACGVNQEINTSWKTKKKWTLHVYGDNHRIIESNVRGCAVCRRPHQCFISSWMSMAWMARTQQRDKNETESGLLATNKNIYTNDHHTKLWIVRPNHLIYLAKEV
jgi:hypothetical protein